MNVDIVCLVVYVGCIRKRVNGSKMAIKFLQWNMRRAKVVTQEARVIGERMGINVMLCQEPYTRGGKIIGFGGGAKVIVGSGPGGTPMAAVIVMNEEIECMLVRQFSNEHCVCVEMNLNGKRVYVISVYFQYGEDVGVHVRFLQGVLENLRGKDVIVGGI